jgi:hypothetical protein
VTSARILNAKNATHRQLVGVERPRVDHDRVDSVEHSQRAGTQHHRIVVGDQATRHRASEGFPGATKRLRHSRQRGRTGHAGVA